MNKAKTKILPKIDILIPIAILLIYLICVVIHYYRNNSPILRFKLWRNHIDIGELQWFIGVLNNSSERVASTIKDKDKNKVYYRLASGSPQDTGRVREVINSCQKINKNFVLQNYVTNGIHSREICYGCIDKNKSAQGFSLKETATAQIKEIIKFAHSKPLNSFILERRNGAHLLNGFHMGYCEV